MKRTALAIIACVSAVAVYAATETTTIKLQISDGLSRTVNQSRTTTGDNFDYRKVSVSTGGELTLTIDTAVGDARTVFLYNPSTNYIEVGFASSNYPIRVRASEGAMFPVTPAQAALYLRAENIASDCEVYISEE